MRQDIKVLVVENQPRSRASLKALLATAPGIGEILEVADSQEALRVVEVTRPHVVLMDAPMPEMNGLGLEATRVIKTRWPHIKVIVLSMYADYGVLALAAGADAFVSKADPPDRLLGTLATVLAPLLHDAPNQN